MSPGHFIEALCHIADTSHFDAVDIVRSSSFSLPEKVKASASKLKLELLTEAPPFTCRDRPILYRNQAMDVFARSQPPSPSRPRRGTRSRLKRASPAILAHICVLQDCDGCS